jgi:hypothetical protein
MVHILMVYIVMVHIVMVHIVMVYIVVVHIVMVYTEFTVCSLLSKCHMVLWCMSKCNLFLP